MPYTLLIPIAILALLVVIIGGVWVLRKGPPQQAGQRFLLYLLGIGVALLVFIFSLEGAWAGMLIRPIMATLTLLSPVILGMLALFFITVGQVFSLTKVNLTLPFPWLLFLLLAILVLLAAIWLQPYGLLVALLPGAFLLAGVSIFVSHRDALGILLSLLLLIFMGLGSSGMTEPMFKLFPPWVGLTLRPVLFFQAGLVVFLAALLTSWAVEGLTLKGMPGAAEGVFRHRFSSLLRLGLALVLLLNLIDTVFWVSVWDHTDDGLGGVWLAITGGLLALGAGGLFIERGRGWLRATGILYLLLVPALIFGAFGLGFKVSYLEITEKRAALIQQAVQSFYTQNGRFPSALDELVPSNLLWVPPQVILRGENWCYQGGADYYRLGVFWRSTFSALLEAKVYASAGSPPDAGWVCQEKLAKMKDKYDPKPFYDGGQ
jgi:hypothetical protein